MFQTWWGNLYPLAGNSQRQQEKFVWLESISKTVNIQKRNNIFNQFRFLSSPGGTLELSQVLPAVFLLRERICWKYQLYISEILIIQCMLYPLILKHNICIKVVQIIRSYAHYVACYNVTIIIHVYLHSFSLSK